MEQDFLNTTGRVFDIQKFSVHDGPGIRTIVFLKGCMFRCRWCCNPESQEYQIQPMTVNNKAQTIGADVAVKEVMKEVLKDRPYYRRSGGGVTLSGGECMCQPDFAWAILHACKEAGINTAVETTAGVPWETVAKLLPEIDYVLMDIKHMDPDKHKEFIGKDNQVILENARKIAESGANLTIRVPVIPTFNHTKEEIKAIANYTKHLKTVKKIHLLPYHRLGQDKYAGLSRPYGMDGILPPDHSYMEELKQVVLNTGLDCQIGG